MWTKGLECSRGITSPFSAPVAIPLFVDMDKLAPRVLSTLVFHEANGNAGALLAEGMPTDSLARKFFPYPEWRWF